MQQCKLGGRVGGELYVLRMKSEEKRAEASSQEHPHASNPEGDSDTKQASEPKYLLHVNFGRKLCFRGPPLRLAVLSHLPGVQGWLRWTQDHVKPGDRTRGVHP